VDTFTGVQAMLFLAAKLFFWVIGVLFLVGMAGSALVVLLTSAEDLKELKGEPKEKMPEFASPHIAKAQPTT
jgi:hypothetical protein